MTRTFKIVILEYSGRMLHSIRRLHILVHISVPNISLSALFCGTPKLYICVCMRLASVGALYLTMGLIAYKQKAHDNLNSRQ